MDRGTDAGIHGTRERASSSPRRASLIRRVLAGRPRRVVALVVVLLLGVAGVAIAGPSGEWAEGGLQAKNGVVKFGPINPVDGYPDWYRDSNGEEVEACLSNFDPMCNAPLPAPNPDEEVSFPDNFPDEFFYFTGEASLTANGGNDVLALYTIEGTYGGAGTQTVFGRTRYRIRGGLVPGEEYKVTNPYGVDTLVAGDDGSIFVTDDVGVGSRNFAGLFEGQVGPFLKWNTDDAPAGYLGDPTVPHAVTGSPYETNFVRIEGPGVGGTGNPNPCPDQLESGSPDCIYTDLFSILGKKSTKGGVDVARATYSLAADEGAKPQIDVMAESKADQDIVVQDTEPGAGRRFPVTPLDAEQGRYYTRVDVKGTLPKIVEVINRKDIPQTVKQAEVTDQVLGAALYTTADDNLHVQASSSDKTEPLTDLTVAGFNKPMDTAGAADITMKAPPTTVRVVSERGGSVEIPVAVQGPGRPPLKLQANAGGDQAVEQGVKVQLDGSASTGNIDSYEWTSADGIHIDGADTPTPSFTAPSGEERDYVITLKVAGPDGVPAAATESTDTVTVHVNRVADPVAKIAFAGALTDPLTPVTVPQNLAVTLDATPSTGASAFRWEVVSGPDVNLRAADQAKLTFTFPKTADDLVLRLTVRNPEAGSGACEAPSCISTTVTLRPEADQLGIGKARFTTDRWVIDGTATSTRTNRVTVYSGMALDPARRIGTADVLPDHTWSVDARASTIPLTTCKCVTVVSDRGGQIVGFPLEKNDRLPDTGVPSGNPPGNGGATAAPAAARALTAVPLAAQALAAAPVATAPRTVTTAAIARAGVPVTVAVPVGATIVRLRVLTTAGKRIAQVFRKVKGGTKAKLRIRSAKLRRKLRPGRRYVLEVRAGTSRTRLGKATRRSFRIRARR
jgi:K319-like protein